ncbi:MAG: hypothetical protein ACE147_02280 [Candidatus Methylomirabilales bacterium]
MARGALRKVAGVALLGGALAAVLLLGALYLALQSPAVLGWLARAAGYDLAVQRIALSPRLAASLTNLRLARLRDDALLLTAAALKAASPLGMLLRGELDSLELESPRFTYRVEAGPGPAAGSGGPDLAALGRLRRIRRLDITNGQVDITFAGTPGQVRLTAANLRIRELTAAAGGSLSFEARVAVRLPARGLQADGRLAGTLRLTGLRPRPAGQGRLELRLDAGAYGSGPQAVSLGGLRLAAQVQYDGRTDALSLTGLEGESRELGSIQGAGQASLRGDRPWSARLSVARMEFARLLPLIRPFLPAGYRGWSLQGTGAVETELQGTYPAGGPAFRGQLALSFADGGFSSPDGSRAAQGLRGRLVLKLEYAPAEDRLAFRLEAEGRDGEVLWGTYYGGLAGPTAALAGEGALWPGARRGEVRGTLDLLQTGEYRFSAGGEPGDWWLRLDVANLSHARLLQTPLGEYLQARSPRLHGLTLTGTSSLQAAVRRQAGRTTIAGTYRMADTTLTAPALPLTVRDVGVELPFDLSYPAGSPAAGAGGPAGRIRVAALRRARLAFEGLQIPVRVAGNALEVPETISLPFFGGTLHLYGARVDDLLFPGRYQLGVLAENVDLGRLTRELAGVEVPGVANADLGYMTYQGDRLTSGGRAVVLVFGGAIEITDFFAENLASPARRLGGNLAFRRISLEEVTRRVAIGKMTGIVQGALRDFVMEYGQPASFVLELESVPTRGVPQRISMDAIQSISILGTGADSGLSRGVARLFREYPYSRIGLRCVLRNDQFTVRGTIHEGGKEYLVRRGWLRGVDVVNQNPDNVISFRDMQERLRRLARPPAASPDGIRVD